MVYTSMKEVIIGKIRDEFTAKYPDIEFGWRWKIDGKNSGGKRIWTIER